LDEGFHSARRGDYYGLALAVTSVVMLNAATAAVRSADIEAFRTQLSARAAYRDAVQSVLSEAGPGLSPGDRLEITRLANIIRDAHGAETRYAATGRLIKVLNALLDTSTVAVSYR
jgi:hypothetical protein